MSDNKQKRIQIYCSEEEYELIEKLAKENKMSLSGYIREIATRGAIMQFGFDNIKAHTRELSCIKAQINDIVRLFTTTNGVYQSDVDELVSLLKEIRDSETKLLRGLNKYLFLFNKKVMKELKKSVDLQK